MSGLGMLGAALSGLGHGTAALAKEYIDRETEQLKQQRLNEWKEREMALQDQYDARSAKRGMMSAVAQHKAFKDIDTDPVYVGRELDAKRQAAQAEIDLKSDPKNVDKVAEAGLRAQAIKDEYMDARWDTDMSHRRQEHQATHPYEAAEMQAKLADYQSKIDQRLAKTKDDEERYALEQQKAVLDGIKYRFGEAGKRLKGIDEQLATGMSDDEGSLVALREEKQRVLSEYQALDGQLKEFLGAGESQSPKGGQLDPKTHPVVGGAQAKFLGGGGNPAEKPTGMLPVADKTPKKDGPTPEKGAKTGKITHPTGVLTEDQAEAYGGLSEGHKALLADMKLTGLDAKAMARLALIPVKTAKMWGRDTLLKVLETGNYPNTSNRVG